jgi:hypothetical protein
MKKITWNQYINRAQNGARTLVETYRFRVVDGIKGDKVSVFIFDDEAEGIYLVSKTQIFEVLALALVMPDNEKQIDVAIMEALGWLVKAQSN